MNLKFKLKLSNNQKKAYDLIHRDEINTLVCNWSRQCGKTVFAEIMLIENLCKNNTFSAYISPSFSQGRKVFNEITKLLDGKNIIKKSNASTLTIETNLNSQLQFFSMESPTAIRGYTVSGILVLDEVAFFPDQLTDGSDPYGNIILPITKARKPKVLMISTPCGKRGLFYDFYNRGILNEDGIASIQATIYDDEFITEEEIIKIKNSMSAIAFQQEFEGVFLDSSLTFFQGFENCFKEFKYEDTIPQWIGVDLSSVGKDETIVTKINQKNQVKQYKIQGTLDQKYQKIADIINNTKNLRNIYIEDNGIGSPMINEIRKLIPRKSLLEGFTTTNSTKQTILSDLSLSISKSTIYFDKEEKELFSQFGTFIFKFTKKGNIQLEAQSGHKDDRVMSLAIALACKTDKENTMSFQARTNSLVKRKKI